MLMSLVLKAADALALEVISMKIFRQPAGVVGAEPVWVCVYWTCDPGPYFSGWIARGYFAGSLSDKIFHGFVWWHRKRVS
jgi:hypothetical protein